MITTTSLIEAFRAEGLASAARDMALYIPEDLGRVVARLNAQVNEELVAALEPFARFYDAWEKMPINNMDDEMYAIHGGDSVPPHGASIRRSQCQQARAAIQRHKPTSQPPPSAQC
jgi:hypothetical protein